MITMIAVHCSDNKCNPRCSDNDNDNDSIVSVHCSNNDNDTMIAVHCNNNDNDSMIAMHCSENDNYNSDVTSWTLCMLGRWLLGSALLQVSSAAE